ncbi:MAG: hypothetical protein HFI38_04725 [Lachnospiraceae bacterium]|jgi:hypothetical protein|nr:hypothetical protein [Lachnospiraceae bacterium]
MMAETNTREGAVLKAAGTGIMTTAREGGGLSGSGAIGWMFPYVYDLEMIFANPGAPLFSVPSVAAIITRETERVNAYYRSAPSCRVWNRKFLEVRNCGDRLKIALYCQKALTPGREGNSLRQFSRFLVQGGLGYCLTRRVRGRLLESA